MEGAIFPLPPSIYTQLVFNKVAIYSLVNEHDLFLCVCSILRIFIHSRGLDLGKRAPESGVGIHRKVQPTLILAFLESVLFGWIPCSA